MFVLSETEGDGLFMLFKLQLGRAFTSYTFQMELKHTSKWTRMAEKDFRSASTNL